MQLEIPECYDSINDALKGAVMAMGGFKKVAGRLRPDDDNGADWLRHCVSGNRRERLTPEQVVWILREARAVGFHAAMDFFALSTGYKATPVDADAQRLALQETIAANMERLSQQVALLAKLQQSAGQG